MQHLQNFNTLKNKSQWWYLRDVSGNKLDWNKQDFRKQKFIWMLQSHNTSQL